MPAKQPYRTVLMRSLSALVYAVATPICSAFCINMPYTNYCYGPSATTPVYEYLNDFTQRRVLLNDPVELNIIDGAPASGWRRTGLMLTMPTADHRVQPTSNPLQDVCRFYAPSLNSHFFTRGAEECAVLNQPGTGWIYERVAFKNDQLPDGRCAGQSTVPVYRYYHSRAAAGNNVHRYSPDRSIKARLEAEGWVDEGISLCAFAVSETPLASLSIIATRAVDTADCGSSIDDSKGCIGVINQPPMAHVLSPSFFDCDFPGTPGFLALPFNRLTGTCSYTAARANYVGDVQPPDLHSFVQFINDYGRNEYGVYLNSRDRMERSAPTSINLIRALPTAAPANATSPDDRVMPWRGSKPVEVDISFLAKVRLVRRGPEGKASAYPTVELMDTLSRRRIVIGIATISTEPQTDFTTRDPATGTITMFTAFREKPAFGERAAGAFVLCADAETAEVGCGQTDDATFKFRLRPVDAAAVIARARALDHSLSPNIADYAVASIRFNQEASGDAEIGLHLAGYSLGLFTR